MDRKPDRAEETAAPYGVSQPKAKLPAATKSEKNKRPVDTAAFKKVADKIFSERKELLHKLAQ